MSNVKFNNKLKPFKEALDTKVQEYFKNSQIPRTGNWHLFAKTAVLIPLATVIYLTLIIFHPVAWVAILLCVAMGLVLSFIGFNIMHDGAHGSYSKNKTVNEIMGLTMNVMGGSDYLWKVKHNIVHHTYTNITGEDEDIDKMPILRFSPEQKRYWYHRYQYIYAPVLYLFSSLSWILFNDYQKYFTRKIEATKIPPMKWKDKIIFWASKVMNISIFLVIPSFVFGFLPAVVGLLIMHGVLGLTLSFVFQMAHCVEDTRFPAPSPDSNKIENEWALHQVATTANFAMRSRLASWILGGLNFQIEHHLFPRISHIHYRALSPLVLETCQEFNVPYIAYPTFSKAVISHMRHLRNMGRKPVVAS
ncbi:MAG TPA: acyl-CoA desaturase [Chitinophagaceae bacterium]|jgi:linoleoyl-CoA desaturase|nr:acyl-CoA desaturase [Chitinophagaceae bacterium]